VHTHRLADHSKADETRSIKELEELRKHDPILILSDQLDKESVEIINKETEISVNEVFNKFENDILKGVQKLNPIKHPDDFSLIPNKFL